MWDVSFPGGSVIKQSPANAGDTGSVPGLGSSHFAIVEQLILCTTAVGPLL